MAGKENAGKAAGNAELEFRVAFRGLQVDAVTQERIARKIRQVVMREIGGLDFRGNLTIAPVGTFEAARLLGAGGEGGHTAGIVARVEEEV